ncbi:hypothetical protein M9Y10_014129 [Tritrichomonas musculus]|uniref:Uncharacterized protein n=1 Tax=Tritrichomonas musculus TaxID=1915356 RepID=A0ABR2KYN3_9EUKA
MHKSNSDSSELENSDQMEPLISPPNQNANVPDGMVSVRFACFTNEKSCCSCCMNDITYLHRHQIVLPEDTTVEQFLSYASRMVGTDKEYSICKVNGIFKLRSSDPIGPTLKSYEYIESPILGLAIPAEKSCCLLI